MALEAFSSPWAKAWADELNASPAYREAAARWEGAVGLVMDDPDPASRKAVILDLWHGSCRSAVPIDADAVQSQAAFIFQGGQEAWRQVFCEGASPVMALMNGTIRLAKGSLAALLPYAAAAKELLELAGKVPTSFGTS